MHVIFYSRIKHIDTLRNFITCFDFNVKSQNNVKTTVGSDFYPRNVKN